MQNILIATMVGLVIGLIVCSILEPILNNDEEK